MPNRDMLWLFFAILCALRNALGVELTFELADNAKDCFYEYIEKNTSITLEYQVVTGGQYDVDVIVHGPQSEVIYRQVKSQFDSNTFVTTTSGEYAVCFGNEFSTFAHKIVYMDWQIGEEPMLPYMKDHATVMTLMESSALDIHKKLNVIMDYQTHHRLKEATSRKRAEDLNETVLYVCLGETIVILCVMLSQVFIVRSFFTDNKPIRPFRRN